jgi:hypothetical protein
MFGNVFLKKEKGDRLGVRDQDSGVRIQDSGIRDQESGVSFGRGML